MAKILGAKCRVCRRLGAKLFLKGSRCDTPKCAIEKRANAPGQHGQRRQRFTDYGLHLREVQRAKRVYGLLGRQFSRYFNVALKEPGNTGEHLMALLERRLDNVIYRLGFALSRAHARQLIGHGHITVNGRKVISPSFWVEAGDIIAPANKEASKKIISASLAASNKPAVPSWLKADADALKGDVAQLPAKEDLQVALDEQLITEYMSR